MNHNVFIARQPILNSKQELYAYELLFRDDSHTKNEANVSDDVLATSRVMVNVMNNMGINKILGDKLGFININEEIIRKNIFEPFDKEKFVFEFLESSDLNEDDLEKVKEMQEEGFRFALDDFILSDSNLKKFEKLLQYIDIVKVDLRLNDLGSLKEKIKVLNPFKVELLAEKVENVEEFELCKELGFQYFQGYFFAKPVIMEGKSIDPKELAILKIIKCIREDAEIDTIEKEFKKNPNMTISLFRYVNSASMSRGKEITSVRQALALIGHTKLLQWLYLMIYAGSSASGTGDPLFVTSSQRAKTMELLMQKVNPSIDKGGLEKAFLTGLLSQIDAVFKVPIQEILKELNLSTEIDSAIISHEGDLGKYLQLIIHSENYDLENVKKLLDELSISNQILVNATLESYSWTESMQ